MRLKDVKAKAKKKKKFEIQNINLCVFVVDVVCEESSQNFQAFLRFYDSLYLNLFVFRI